MSVLDDYSHRRWNPLKKEWVLVSPHRAKRPWKGAVEKNIKSDRPEHDGTCQLCPKNTRANGEINPAYLETFVFDNDFPALSSPLMDNNQKLNNHQDLFKSEIVSGVCRVICFSPKHNLTLAEFTSEQIVSVINCWHSQYQELSHRNDISHVMIFENKGEMMGCSNPHPHGQIWATSYIPNLSLTAAQAQSEYYIERKSHLLHDYLGRELELNERIIFQNESWVVLVPFWAVWPYEVMLLPKRTVATIDQMTAKEINDWAESISTITRKYDKLFDCSFPYSMGVYQKPCDGGDWLGFSVYQTFLPPLLRSATVKKHMVGFELCAEAQRDITPEMAAQKLASL